ncbi:hypothetical protein WSM22_26340 [Cytophagales bacterium WSM2-2]|nr:hypothetical protein WSM22_26340 [Cytophagales bacterium WSM2-2]
MNSLKKALKAPFPYFLNEEKKNVLLCFGVCVFLIGFILVFNPKAIHAIDKTMLIVAFTFLVLFPGVILAPRVFPAAFDTDTWTFGKHLAFTGILVLIIGMVITTGLYTLGYYPRYSFAQTMLHIYPDVFTYGMIPITLVTLITRNQMLRENLRSALNANLELDKIQRLKEQTQDQRNTNSIIIHSDTSETLTLNVSELLFVEADDNYSTFYWRNGASVEKRILRMNLKSAENQLNNDFTIRCHRSFIVNINVIGAISGNTNGYKLSVTGYDYSIPVSRAKGKEVIDKIGQIRSVMELQ